MSSCHLQNLFEVPQRIVKIKSAANFFLTKYFETLRPLRVKNPIEIYREYSTESSSNLLDF